MLGAGPLGTHALALQQPAAGDGDSNPSTVVREMRDLRRAGQSGQALDLWESQTKAIQDDPRILGHQAQALLDLRRVSEAWKLLKPFDGQEVSQPTPFRVAMARVRFARGDRRAARVDLRDLRRENPQSLDLAALSIRLCLVDRRWSEAVQQIDGLEGPSSGWVKSVLRADLAGALGRAALGEDDLLARSAELLSLALEQHPGRGDLRAIHVRSLDRLGEHELAETQSTLGAQLVQDGLDGAVLALAVVSRLQLAGDMAGALEHVDVLLAEKPRDRDALAARAACLAELDQVDEARAVLAEVFKKGGEEEHVEGLLVLAGIERARGDLLAWDRTLRRVLKVEPGEPRALAGLIAALEAQDQPAVRAVFLRMQARAVDALAEALEQALAFQPK